MASQMPQPDAGCTTPTDLAPRRLSVLTRLALDGGTTRAELARDLGGLLTRAAIDLELAALAASDLTSEIGRRLVATPAGRALAADVLGLRSWPRQWAEIRDVRLPARALGLERCPGRRIGALARPENLRAEILGRAFGLKHRSSATPSRLRADLAVVALERAFGNRIRGGLGAGAGAGFAPKAGRMLASQLLARPRDLGTDARLVAALAAELVSARGTDAESLRTAVLKAWLAGSSLDPIVVGADQARPGRSETPLGDGEPAASLARPKPDLPPPSPLVPTRSVDLAAPPVPAPAIAPLASAGLSPAAPLARPPAATRPDLAGFVSEVQRAASAKAQGWPGNRKAFIVHVFDLLCVRHPEWGLSEIEFKAMLAEAHRTGHLALVTADLRDKSQMQELARSAITYKNTVWHLVRVAE